MDKLKLPIIKEPIGRHKPLSMDDYLRFVRFNLQYTVDKRAAREWKKLLFVNVLFSLK